MTVIILAVALIGLFAVNVDRAGADKMSALYSKQSSGVDSTLGTSSALTGGSAAGSIFKMLSALVIVIACIYLGIYLLKKLMGRKYGGYSKDNLLQVIETTYVGPKKTVSLVRVADKAVLIGVTDNTISVLTELDEAKTAEIMPAVAAEESKEPFSRFLTSASVRLKEFRLKKSGVALDG